MFTKGFLTVILELQFLKNSVVFLYPIGAIALGYIISLLLGFNATVFVMDIYFP